MKNLYLCINSTKIGGAEKRSLRMAGTLADLKMDWKVHYVLPMRLWEVMQANKELAGILENPKISFHVYDRGDEATTKKENGRLMRLYLKRKFIPGFLQRWLIKRYSERFYTFMSSRLRPGDIYHHFFGFTGLAVGLRLKERVSLSICELTSPVYGPVVTHYWRLFKGSNQSKLRLIAVTEVIYNQVQAFISGKRGDQVWMDNHLRMYPLPFLKPPPPLDLDRKENLMVYASNFFERKNPLMFATAIAELLREGELTGWKISMRGKGPLDERIRSLLSRPIESGRVEVGFSDNLEEELLMSKIYVSIISTGNYPSQSAFEAYARGNILLLSDRGNTREKFTHPAFQFVDLDMGSLKNGILACTRLAEGQEFDAVSAGIHSHYSASYDHHRVLDWLHSIYGESISKQD